MKFKTVDEYIATLSEEEKERHKDLIEECRKREEQNKKSSEANREAAARLLGAQEGLRKETTELLDKTKELIDVIHLSRIPKDGFVKA